MITEEEARSCPFHYRHEWRQKLERGNPTMKSGGYYCIHCLKEIKYGEQK